MPSGQPELIIYVVAGVVAIGSAFLARTLLRARSSRPSVEKWLPSASGYSSTGAATVRPVRPCYRRQRTTRVAPGPDGSHAKPSAAPQVLVSHATAVLAPVLVSAPLTPRPPGQLYRDRYSANSSVPYDPWQALYSSMAARGQTKPSDNQPRHSQRP